jgi:hypothetical protein
MLQQFLIRNFHLIKVNRKDTNVKEWFHAQRVVNDFRCMVNDTDSSVSYHCLVTFGSRFSITIAGGGEGNKRLILNPQIYSLFDALFTIQERFLFVYHVP